METLKQRLKALRLKGFSDNLENRVQQALAAHLSYDDFLNLLVEDQEALRFAQGYNSRLKKSNLNPVKMLDNYNYANQPSVNPKQIAQLATCEFIDAKQKIIMIGVSGVGKTFLTNGIGLKAIEKGYKVLQYSSSDLADLLLQAKEKGTYESLIKDILSNDLVIIDEMCLNPYPEGGATLLMRLMDKLDENLAVAFTSNRELSGWLPFFPDEVVASAFVDRAINCATIIRIIGDSNRSASHRQQ